ncbi:MAG: Gfo/Idh/MocA family protein [Chthoniobacterales bacterium]
MSLKNKVHVGILGCGNISQAYFNGSKMFDVIDIVACADINPEAAKAKAKENNCLAQSVDELLANPDVDLIVNLTIPAVHAEVSQNILRAGKHVYLEKPLATNLEDAQKTLDLAKEKNLLVGCAPDTFLGAGLQTCRKVIDDQKIGRIVAGTTFLMSRGPAHWHPNPGFFYQPGAGPLFDMGPYYITALVHLLGPVKEVSAVTSQAFKERIAGHEEIKGTRIPVDVQTHFSGTLIFHSGAVITTTFSFDVHAHTHNPIELYGTEGSIALPDPNTFAGPVKMWKPDSGEWSEEPLTHPYEENSRSIGAADMAYSILSKTGRPFLASGELAFHALEVMSAYELSSDQKRSIPIKSKPSQPVPLQPELIEESRNHQSSSK